MNPSSTMLVLNVVAGVIFAGGLATRVVDPLVPQIAFDLHVDPATAALLASAFSLPYALMQPVLGAVADTVGKIRTMAGCMIVLVIAVVAGMFATDFGFLLATRALAGAASGGLFPIGIALVGDQFSVEKRQIAMGRILAAVMTGSILGASASGFIGDWFGWRGAFLFMALVGAIATMVLVLGTRGRVKETATAFDLRTQLGRYSAIAGNPLAKFCFIAVFLEGAFVIGLFPYIATMLHETGETRASIAGIVLAGFGLGGVTYTIVVTHLVRHVPVRLMMLIGGCCMGLGLALIALQVAWPFLFAIFFLQGFALYLLHGPIQVVVTELAPAARSSAAALHSVFFISGQAAGPLFYRFGFDHFGEATTLLIGALAMVFAGAQAAFFLRAAKAGVKS
jgi:predicted MFS family arabinose efflux permease